MRSMTVGTPRPEEMLSDRVRQILIGLGYSEIMSLPLTTEEHQFERLRIADARALPASRESETQGVQRRPRRISWAACSKRSAKTAAGRCRSGCSKSTMSSSSTTRPKRVRPKIAQVALVEIGRESGYATARSVVDALLRELGWQAEYEAIEHPTFVPGRAARILRRRQADRHPRRSPPRSAHQLRPHVSGRARRTDAGARLLNCAQDAEGQRRKSLALRSLRLCVLRIFGAIALACTIRDHVGMVDDPRVLTIPAFLANAVERRGDEPALGTIRGGELRWRTWRRDWATTSQALAATLRAAGVQPGDRVAQVSENRYEWIIIDLALHLAGAVHVPIHVTLSGEQIAEQIAASGARLVFVSTAELLAKFAERLTHGETVFVHDEQDVRRGEATAGQAQQLAPRASQPPVPSPTIWRRSCSPPARRAGRAA